MVYCINESSDSVIMLSSGAVLVSIQQNTIRYGFPILIVLGNIGNLLLILIFTRRHHRHNPCSLYLLASAIFSLVGLNWSLITNLNALYQVPDPFTLSVTLCRLRGYILQATSVLYRTMIILACIDRYAMSSTSVRIRAFSKRNTAIKMIIGTTLFWLLVTIQQPIFQTIQSNRCGVFGVYGLFFSIYQICLFGGVFPGWMIAFGVLLWKNLKDVRIRIRATTRVVAAYTAIAQMGQLILHKRDISLMRFVLVEIMVAVVLSILFPINSLYIVLASNVPNKSVDRLQIEGFMTFVAQLVLLYLNYCVTFYVYVIMSQPFRAEIRRLLFNYLRLTTVREAPNIPPVMPLRNIGTKSNRVCCSSNQTWSGASFHVCCCPPRVVRHSDFFIRCWKRGYCLRQVSSRAR